MISASTTNTVVDTNNGIQGLAKRMGPVNVQGIMFPKATTHDFLSGKYSQKKAEVRQNEESRSSSMLKLAHIYETWQLIINIQEFCELDVKLLIA